MKAGKKKGKAGSKRQGSMEGMRPPGGEEGAARRDKLAQSRRCRRS